MLQIFGIACRERKEREQVGPNKQKPIFLCYSDFNKLGYVVMDAKTKRLHHSRIFKADKEKLNQHDVIPCREVLT